MPGNPAPDPGDGDFHFLHQAAHRQGNVLNTGMAYVAPFWYADPCGIYGQSSLVGAVFDPASVPAQAARGFRARSFRRLGEARLSRYAQPERVERFPAGCIAVFLQGASDFVEAARHMGTVEMIEAVLEAATGPGGGDQAASAWGGAGGGGLSCRSARAGRSGGDRGQCA